MDAAPDQQGRAETIGDLAGVDAMGKDLRPGPTD